MEAISDCKGRIDAVISQVFCEISRSYAQKLIGKGRVRVNNKVIIKPSELIAIGDFLCVDMPELADLEVISEDIPLDIVYEDEDLLVVNKPKGMVVHPANGHTSGTLVNAVLHHCKGELSGINGVARPGIVHRIDKDTSGLLLVAKNDNAHRKLAQQIKKHTLTRGYLAIVNGNVKEEGIVNAPIGRSAKDRKKMGVALPPPLRGTSLNPPRKAKSGLFGDPGIEGGNAYLCELPNGVREAITHYKPIGAFAIKGKNVTLIECRLETGRTHQIRVHMAHIGHAVLGDEVYGTKNAPSIKTNGQLLHAYLLGFIHPETHEYMEFTSPLPKEFEGVLPKSLLPLRL